MLKRTTIRSRSLRSRFTSWFLKRKFKPILLDENFDPVRFRKSIEHDMSRTAPEPSVEIQAVEGQAFQAEWQVPAGAPTDSCMLYCHGGGYLFGSPRAYRAFTTRLAQACGRRVLVLDYRLAPEFPFPAAADDVLLAYRYLLQDFSPEQILVAGDSAGAGLTLSLLHQLQQHELGMPAAAMLLSPYADLLCTGTSLDSNSDSCAMFSGDAIRRAAATYLAGQDGADPMASPLYADYQGFPPLLIYVSDSEVLRDDGMRVAEKAADAGVTVDLRIWRGQPHVWPLFVPVLPEARRVVIEMAEFARQG